MAVIPSTEMDAVNDLLISIQREPLTSYPSASPSLDEAVAASLLNKHNRDAQTMKDWKFNYAENVTLTADGSGNMIVGTTSTANIARVTLHETNPAAPLGSYDVELRLNGSNWQLFDITNQSFTSFGASATIKVNITYWRTFGETPEAFRRYVTARAKQEFLLCRQGARELIGFAQLAEKEAWAELIQDHLYKAGTKAHSKTRLYRTVFDNYDAARPLIPRPPSITSL